MSSIQPEISRVTRTKEEARTSYDKMAKWYDLIALRSEKKYTEAGLNKLGAHEGETILEIGFGTGHSILSLAKAVGNRAKVYGIDISPQMLKITQSRVDQANLSRRVDLKQGDAAKLPFEKQFFDAIFMSFTLELFDTQEIPVVLNKCRRALRQEGRICVVAMSKDQPAGLLTRIYEWAHKKFPKYVDCRPIFLQESLEQAGFKILDDTRMSLWGLPVEIALAQTHAQA